MRAKFKKRSSTESIAIEHTGRLEYSNSLAAAV
jgi:hypothetical protein